MANQVYDNFYLSNEVEDQYNSHLDLQQFLHVKNLPKRISNGSLPYFDPTVKKKQERDCLGYHSEWYRQ